MTEGERWARDALADLASARWRPAAIARFLLASQRRANLRRRERPELARQAQRWLLAGALAYAPGRPPGAVRWWIAVALMLDWHLGMLESEDGEPRPLGPADACTLLRAWLVPVVAQRHRPVLVAAGLASDVLDGALARASVPTRAGRDLEALVDGAFAVAALRAAPLPRAVVLLEALRIAAGVGATTTSYLRGAPVRAPRDRAAAVLRAIGLLSGRPRLGGTLVLAGAVMAADTARRYARAMSKPERDVEKVYSAEEMAQKLRRFADSLESGETFRISIAGEQIRVPKRAQWSIEHEREGDSEEIEFQIRWSVSEED